MIELKENEWRYVDSKTKEVCPWYVKGVIEMLYKMDLRRKKIFEYGAGNSTHWFRSRGAIIEGVDSNLAFADMCRVKFEPYFPAYVDYLDNFEKFDIIIIDGDWREECFEKALNHLITDGFIIIDNFEQPSADLPNWPNTRRLIEERNLKLEIYKEEKHQDWQTAIIRL